MTRSSSAILLAVALVAAGAPDAAAQSSPTTGDDVATDAAARRAYAGANGLLNRGLYDLAISEYESFLDRYPDHHEATMARYGLGVSHFRLGRHRAALAALGPVFERPRFAYAAEVATVIGQCHVSLGDHASAVAPLERVVTDRPDHALADDAAALLVEAHYLAGRPGAALEARARLAERWPDSPLRDRADLFAALSEMARGRFDAASHRLETLSERTPDGPYADQVALLLAQCLHRSRVLPRAVEQYHAVIRRAHDQFLPEALYGLAAILHEQGKGEGAGKLLDDLIERFPAHALAPDARLLRGRVWFESGHFDRALPLFVTLADEGGAHAAAATYWRAKCDLRGGDADAAARRLDEALERYPRSPLRPEMTYDYAVALVQADEPRPAIATLRSFLEQHPEHPLAAPALHLLAVTLHRVDDLAGSARGCRDFETAFPDHTLRPDVAFLAVENAFLLGAHEDAVAMARALLADHPDHAQRDAASFRLGMALYHLGRADEAVPVLERVVALEPSPHAFRPALLALGDLAFQTRAWTDAERHLVTYLADGLDAPAADDALLKIGLARHRLNRLDDALGAYDLLLVERPESPHRVQALFERGQALLALDRDDEAAEAFGAVLESDAHGRFAMHASSHLGVIALADDDYDAAAGHFGRAAGAGSGAEPAAAEALAQQGRALMSAGRFDRAEAAFDALLDLRGAEAHALEARAWRAIAVARQGDAGRALPAIEAVERGDLDELDASLRAAVVYEKAWCLRSLERPADAAHAYRRLLGSDAPVDLLRHARLELAELEADAGRHDAAAERLRELLASGDDGGPPLPPGLRDDATERLAVRAYERERYKDAAALLEELFARDPARAERPGTRLVAGEAHYKSGAFTRAVEHLEAVTTPEHADDPAYGPALLRLGESRAALQHWARSEAAFAEYLTRFPESDLRYQARFGVGWALENQGRWVDAANAYRNVVEHHQGPTAARAQFQIGQCLFARKEYQKAARALLKVDILYAYPEWSAAALYEAGRCFEALGDPAQARAQFEKVRREHGTLRWSAMAGARLDALSKSGLPGRGASRGAGG